MEDNNNLALSLWRWPNPVWPLMVIFTILPFSQKPQAFKATGSVVQLRGDGMFLFNWSEPQVHFRKWEHTSAHVWVWVLYGLLQPWSKFPIDTHVLHNIPLRACISFLTIFSIYLSIKMSTKCQETVKINHHNFLDPLWIITVTGLITFIPNKVVWWSQLVFYFYAQLYVFKGI